MMDRKSIESLIAKFASLKILVLGDFMLDHFIWGRVDRVSPEAPVPVVDMESETFSLGGAGNVVSNLVALGAQALPVGVIGDDSTGQKMLEILRRQKIPSHLLLPSGRPTTLKSRVLAHQQQIVRIDREDRTLISEELQSALAQAVLDLLPIVDGIILSDYSKGAITPNLLERILPAARQSEKLFCLDPKVRYFRHYTPVTVMTPNQMEASTVLGYPIVSEADLREAGKRILQMIDCRALLITRGEKGMALFEGEEMRLIPARAREVYDVTGAGDTVISVLC
ncbi:MAG TPA: PfkB family carbohydrate kinase, partial [Acidobacteriota bacterium]|nr:PfkB family carbohydrate kinase [Acidobacteriota bacterium]